MAVAADVGNAGRGGGRARRQRRGKKSRGDGRGGESAGRFRVQGVKLPWREDVGKDSFQVDDRLAQAVARRMGLQEPASLPASAVQVVRKSFDARRQAADKSWAYVVDVELVAATAANAGKRPRTRPGRCEWLRDDDRAEQPGQAAGASSPAESPRVVVIGSGPAGLFAAVSLAEAGQKVLLLERGRAVEKRGRDIGALFARRKLNADSNLCYGEGGAGTWSDGKLTTRIGRNGDPVRQVLALLHKFGAPDSVLMAGKPHLGTDRLVRILRGCREYLQARGVEIRFDTSVEEVVVEERRVRGVRLAGSEDVIPADDVVLAVGHSARALYETLLASGVQMEPKPFAMGFRIEHPQAVIDEIQYGADDAAETRRGAGPIPVADYKLAATMECSAQEVDELQAGLRDGEWDTLGETWREQPGGEDGRVPARPVYSFCMCPGGQVVPTATTPELLCVNGMSFSRRNSKWANSALVVGIQPQDSEPWLEQWGALAGVKLQEEMERRAARMGGGDLVAPAQRALDFLDGTLSAEPLPSCSYRLGIRSAPCHLLFPAALTAALRAALRDFDRKMPGFLHPEALLIGAETRTSAPVCITRHADTMESTAVEGLWPAGEGAGYAGGIVSAAVDGMQVGRAVAAKLSGVDVPEHVRGFKASTNFY